MSEYYRGHIRHHATFWVDYRELPHEKRFTVFLNFFKQLEKEVKNGKCNLRDAGYALKPGSRDEDIVGSNRGDIGIACLTAADLARWFYDYDDEALDDWAQIVSIFEKYL